MKRVLTFEGPRAPKRFQLLWTALTNAGDGKGERTPAVIRKEARLQDAFEAISDPAAGNGAGPDPEMRTLKMEGATVTLETPDFDLLHQYTEKTAWNPRISRDVVDTWDWLSTAEKED